MIFLESRNLHGGEMPAGNYVLMSISDTGYGMELETIEHIFEPFFTTKADGKGTGIGLSTVYGIVKSASGCIEVSSSVGKGSLFKVYLPETPGSF
jgi:signal transduction histidine kinase